MNIEELAKQAGFSPAWAAAGGPSMILENFAALIREAVVQELVAGSGEPVAFRAQRPDGDPDLIVAIPLYTAEQLAGAVARERERCAKDVNSTHALQRLLRIMGTFDLATGHADTFDDALDSLESELRDVLGHYRAALTEKQEPWCKAMNRCEGKCDDCPDPAPEAKQEAVAWMWQPIETAPKDETEILLMSAKGRIANGMWVTVNADKGYWAWPYVKVEPVKWMPMPSTEAKHEADSTCSDSLRLQGKPYQRTCKKCGLGPCIGKPTPTPSVNAQLLTALKEAVDDIEHWGSYASEYFQKKHDLQGNLEKHRAAIAATEGKV